MTSYWLAAFSLALGTFLLKFCFLSGRLKPPRRLALGLKFVPMSALAALVASGFFRCEKNITLGGPALLAALAASLAAWAWPSTAWPIISGSFRPGPKLSSIRL